MDSIRLYLRYVATSIRAQMQYRASFLMLTGGNFLGTAIEFLTITVLFDRFKSIRGWSLAEIAMFYGMANIAFSLSEAIVRGFDTFSQMVKSGDFDRLLVRPRSTVLQVLGRELQLMRVGRFAQGVVVLLWAVSRLGIAWTPGKVLLMIAAILGGSCLFAGLFILQATMSFWTIESLEIMNTVTYGGVEATEFPMSIYRPWFQRFLTMVVPLACLNYFPGLAILGRPDPLGLPDVFHWLSPLVGVLFLAVCIPIWKFGVRHYCSTGS